MSYGVDHGCGSHPKLLWLWCRPEAVAPIQPLAQESPYAVGVALKKKKELAVLKTLGRELEGGTGGLQMQAST